MFLKADEEYKSDFVQNTSPEFEDAIRTYLKNNPGMSEKLGIKLSAYKNDAINTGTDIEISKIGLIEKRDHNNTQQESNIILYTENQSSQETNYTKSENKEANYTKSENKEINYPKSENKETSDKYKKIKTLYRKIATRTHPDKVKIKFLNDLYLKAKNYYQKNDLFSLYLICNDIDIEYNLDDDEIIDFKRQINQLKDSNKFVEETYLWLWHFEQDEDKKSQIISHFIQNNPNQVRPIV